MFFACRIANSASFKPLMIVFIWMKDEIWWLIIEVASTTNFFSVGVTIAQHFAYFSFWYCSFCVSSSLILWLCVIVKHVFLVEMFCCPRWNHCEPSQRSQLLAHGQRQPANKPGPWLHVQCLIASCGWGCPFRYCTNCSQSKSRLRRPLHFRAALLNV